MEDFILTTIAKAMLSQISTRFPKHKIIHGYKLGGKAGHEIVACFQSIDISQDTRNLLIPQLPIFQCNHKCSHPPLPGHR